MAESTFQFEETLEVPFDAAWAAMRRTSDLDVMGGQRVVERISDSEWVTQLENDKNTTHCTAVYDETARTVTVTADSTAKRANDTTVIAAEDAGNGRTLLRVSITIRGGAIVAGMLKLVGKTGTKGAADSIARNVAAIAAGEEGRAMTQDEIEGVAQERLSQLTSRFKKHGK